ncbi:hypothetical protein [Aurantivibrio plasticivorans]
MIRQFISSSFLLLAASSQAAPTMTIFEDELCLKAEIGVPFATGGTTYNIQKFSGNIFDSPRTTSTSNEFIFHDDIYGSEPLFVYTRLMSYAGANGVSIELSSEYNYSGKPSNPNYPRLAEDREPSFSPSASLNLRFVVDEPLTINFQSSTPGYKTGFAYARLTDLTERSDLLVYKENKSRFHQESDIVSLVPGNLYKLRLRLNEAGIFDADTYISFKLGDNVIYKYQAESHLNCNL